jgi:hypothetical protein
MEMNTTTADRIAYRETMQSGLADMMIASFFIVPGVLDSRPGLTGLIIIPLILLGPVYRAANRRYIEPRLGYAELKGEPPGRLLTGIALFMVAAIAILGLVLLFRGFADDPGMWRRSSPALAGVLFSGGLIYAGQRAGLMRYHLLALFSVVCGFVLAILIQSASYQGLRTYLLITGTLVFVNGLTLFLRFTRNHPIRKEASNGSE